MILRGLMVVVVVDEVLVVFVDVAMVVVGATVVVVVAAGAAGGLVVVVVDVIVNEIDADVAVACEPFAEIDALIVHVPAATKVTAPLDESIVHTEVVELEYVFEPPPADAVEVMVGSPSPMS